MKKVFFGCILFMSVYTTIAKEGMWIPLLLQQYNASDMENMGLKISVSDIYDANHSSMKDAVVLFGGGCTAEIISNQGLLLTNHHCGYGQIQKHSSLQHDYLSNGFWAMNLEDELPNEELTVTFIKRIEDVSEIILDGITDKTSESVRSIIVKKRIDSIQTVINNTEGLGAQIKPFYYGNQYYLFVTQVYSDVRLVGAPPSSIGKYGFDTDNWVWPRHTGDFSMFRIYADSNNNPAPYSPNNVPYKPKYHFPISLDGVKENDFSMVYGFPARTQEYLPSVAVDFIINQENPAKISMRNISLNIINSAMRSSAELNIKYAAKQSRISNAWKKYQGQIQGLKKTNAIAKKKQLEETFTQQVKSSPHFHNYKHILPMYFKEFEEYKRYAMARSMFIEIFYYGPEILRFSSRFEALTKQNLTDIQRKNEIAKLRKITNSYFKDYSTLVDAQLFEQLIPQYMNTVGEDMLEMYLLVKFGLNSAKLAKKITDKVYSKSIFSSKEKVLRLLDGFDHNSVKNILSDPAFMVSKSIRDSYFKLAKSKYENSRLVLNGIQRKYIEALMNVLPDYKNYYPDANFTLRLSYGKVKGSEPVDGIVYKYFTTLEGVIQKMDTTSYEYNLPQKVYELYQNKDFGKYADLDGTMHVCYTATNHTSGGNSGSPALNAYGQLVGLNFDRTWESTMSDIMFDTEICRNIMVDIRYVLFLVDKYAGATRLIDEMSIIE